jgi:hypothetical protein
MTQPRALFLADILEDAGKPADIIDAAAAELRRLHAQRDALLEALLKCSEQLTRLGYSANHADQAIAVIKAVEENT